jgi:arylsulfatase A-like enzyme
MRYLLFSFLVTTLITCKEKPGNQSGESVGAPPNILMIAIDDLNNWLGCLNGHPGTKTPHMDQLARSGVLFTNAHCQAPLCGPSRASLMSGLRPSSTGIYGQIKDNNIRRDNPDTEQVIFLPEYFRNHGYYTMGIGKLFHNHAPEGVFDESGGRVSGFGPLPDKRLKWEGRGGEGYGNTSTDWGAFPNADSLMPDFQSADWAKARLSRSYDKPFFLAVGFLRPHVPWLVPQHWFDHHPVEDISLPPYHPDDLNDLPEIALRMDDLPMMPTTEWAIESGEWVHIVQAYLACITFVDHCVGEVIDALYNSPHADNTIIVLWSDHGYRLGEKGTFAKHCLWEEATNAPLIFAGPGISKGQRVNAPAEMLSIYPTLLDLCGLPANPNVQGQSLAHTLRGEEALADTWALTTYGWKNHALRTERYRYIEYEDGSEELYDRHVDPNEWNNLAQNPEYRALMDQLKAELPRDNVPYAVHSIYTYNPFFRAQKMRSMEMTTDH